MDVLALLADAGFEYGKHYELTNFTPGSGLARDRWTRLAAITFPLARTLHDFTVTMTWESAVAADLRAEVAVHLVPRPTPLRMRLPGPRPDRAPRDPLRQVFAPLLGSACNNEEDPVRDLILTPDAPEVLTTRLRNNGVGPAIVTDVRYDLAAAGETGSWTGLRLLAVPALPQQRGIPAPPRLHQRGIPVHPGDRPLARHPNVHHVRQAVPVQIPDRPRTTRIPARRRITRRQWTDLERR